MKIYSIVSFFIFLAFNINGQVADTFKIDLSKYEPGSCYFSLTQNKTDNGSNDSIDRFILEAVPPKFDTIRSSYSVNDLKRFLTRDSSYLFTMSESHLVFAFRDIDLSTIMTKQRNPQGYLYCLIEVPRQTRTIRKSQISSDSIYNENIVVVEESKIVKRYVSSKPEELNQNQIYVEGKNWTEIEVAVGKPSCHGRPSIVSVKTALVSLGYSLEINNVLDENTRAALIDFQKKNNLEIGQFSRETLVKLGLR